MADLDALKVASWYTLVIYTASMPENADPVIDWLDGGRGFFAKKLYRDSCYLQTTGSYVKDLALVEADLSRVCFMDNSPISYSWNKGLFPLHGSGILKLKEGIRKRFTYRRVDLRSER